VKAGTFLFLFSACLMGQRAGVEGTVVNSVTGEPLSGAHIRLFSLTRESPREAYGAISGSDGHFSITGMPPGEYALIARRAGFIYIESKDSGTAVRAVHEAIPGVELKPGERLAGFKVAMSPRAVIRGHVVDEYGDPVERVQVRFEPASPNALSGIFEFGAASSTDDHGEFRFSGAPGKYYIQAQAEGVELPPAPDGTAYANTWYPSAASKNRAETVEAIAGREVTGIAIRLSTNRTFRISGTVSGIPRSDSRPQIDVTLLRSDGTSGMGVQPDGKFAFSGLQPGSYRIYAHYSGGKTQLQSRPADIRLDGSDITNLQLTLASGGGISGTVEIHGQPAPAGRIVRLDPIPESGITTPQAAGEVDANGAFRMVNVAPGRFRVHVEPLPENAYIKTVQVDGDAAPGGVLDFSHGAAGNKLKILVSPNGGQIHGKVLDKDGAPLTRAFAMVVLTEDAKPFGVLEEQPVESAGTYSFKGLKPGKYRVFAIDALHSSNWEQDGQDTMQRLAAAADEIEIREGSRIAKDVKAEQD
jgi:hypothetical protein